MDKIVLISTEPGVTASENVVIVRNPPLEQPKAPERIKQNDYHLAVKEGKVIKNIGKVK